MKKLLKATFFLAISTILAGCGGGGGGSGSASSSTPATGNKVSVTGKFGSGYAYYKNHWWNKLFPRALATYGTVEKLIAIPVSKAGIWVNGIQEVQVNSDGSFNLSLAKQYKSSNVIWIVLAKKTDGTYQVLSVGAQDIGDSLVDFPIYSATANIDVGTVSPSGDEAKGDKDVSDIASSFSVGLNGLKNIAMFDDVLKALLNFIRNNYEKYGKSESKYIEPVLHVTSTGNYTDLSNSATYTLAYTLEGYAFHFHGGPDSVISTNFDNVKNGEAVLRLFPPEDIEVGDTTYNTTNPISSSGLTCSSTSDGSIECSNQDNFYMRKDPDGSVTLNFVTGDKADEIVSTFPVSSKYFELKMDNTLIGTYKFSTALPLINTGTGRKLKLPIPGVKLDTDNNGKIKGVYVKWYVWNSTSSSYEELTDYIFLRGFSGTFGLNITDYNGVTGNTSRLDISCGSIKFGQTYINVQQCEGYPPGGIYYNYSGEDKYSAETLELNYVGASGVEYRFAYRKP